MSLDEIATLTGEQLHFQWGLCESGLSVARRDVESIAADAGEELRADLLAAVDQAGQVEEEVRPKLTALIRMGRVALDDGQVQAAHELLSRLSAERSRLTDLSTDR